MRPLIAALAGEHLQTADLLHHNGADVRVRGLYENSPLHSAAGHENFEVVRKLIGYCADINARDEDGGTPLFDATDGECLLGGSVHRLLLEHGADISAQKRDSQTPLHRASRNGALNVVRLLLEHGADVEAKNKHGQNHTL